MELILKRIVEGFNPKINKKVVVRLATGLVALSSVFVLSGCKQTDNNLRPDGIPVLTAETIETKQEIVEITEPNVSATDDKTYAETGNYSNLQLESLKFAGKYYVTINKTDLMALIEKSIKDCEKEYVDIGATPCFSVNSNKFSEIDEKLISALFEVESSFRLIELVDIDDKNVETNLYNLEKYKRFCGEATQKNENGEVNITIYHGLGMMDSTSIKDYIYRDRTQVNKFKNSHFLKIDDKEIEISFENINPYDYIVNSNAKSEDEIKKALAENVQLTARSCVAMLHRAIKDGVKEGKHDNELQVLNGYKELEKYSQEEKQIWFALLCYNEGYNRVYNAMINNKLFEKDSKGEYVLNIKYSEKVFEIYYQLIKEYGSVKENKNEDLGIVR
ncbi:MAG: hypothetical protein IJX26_03025 [Clostridia bacterium]|nr:hypothetical protein [Clostridia bacterium]